MQSHMYMNVLPYTQEHWEYINFTALSKSSKLLNFSNLIWNDTIFSIWSNRFWNWMYSFHWHILTAHYVLGITLGVCTWHGCNIILAIKKFIIERGGRKEQTVMRQCGKQSEQATHRILSSLHPGEQNFRNKKGLNRALNDEQKMARMKRQQNWKHVSVTPQSTCVHQHEQQPESNRNVQSVATRLQKQAGLQHECFLCHAFEKIEFNTLYVPN